MIRFDRVGLTFGERSILRDSTFTFERDTVYVIKGASGTGKSSVLNLAAGYLAPSSGTVQVDGTIEYLMQDELLFSELTVAENLSIRTVVAHRSDEPGEHQVRIKNALGRLGLADRIGERVGSLSGGERRRVELAGTLLSDPEVLLLDEPVANLDASSAADVYDAVWAVRGNRTVVVVTHEPNPALPGPSLPVTLSEGTLRTP